MAAPQAADDHRSPIVPVPVNDSVVDMGEN
jgi:hypothetical protein